MSQQYLRTVSVEIEGGKTFTYRGAMKGVRAGLSMYGIEVDDEICTQVAITVLTGFALKGGLEPESLERLRDLVVRAETARQEH